MNASLMDHVIKFVSIRMALLTVNVCQVMKKMVPVVLPSMVSMSLQLTV